MQRKTIQKVIRLKMEDWLLSITDEKLRKDVQNNLLVSGGSIASLFQGQPVNDYDVYINDIDVLHRLVMYYVVDKQGVEIFDGRNQYSLARNFLYDGDLLYLLNGSTKFPDIISALRGINSSRAIAIRTLKPNQIKAFFSGGADKGGKKFEYDEEGSKQKYRLMFMSPNAMSLSDDIQIVMRFHGDNEEIHKTFDFVHATNYFTFKDGLVTNIDAVESLLTKQLKYQGSMYPLTSIIRMKKFINRNWNINAGEILKIMFQISELDLKNPDVLEEQLIGVDVAYFGTLISILRGVDANKLTSEYLNAIIDKVFNEDTETEI